MTEARPALLRGGMLPEIEALRGVAIALVVGLHADAIVLHPPIGLSFDVPARAASLPLAFVRVGTTGVYIWHFPLLHLAVNRGGAALGKAPGRWSAASGAVVAAAPVPCRRDVLSLSDPDMTSAGAARILRRLA